MKKEEGRHKEFVGVVTSNAMKKTIVVDVVSPKLDTMYKKYLKRTKRIAAHDEKNTAMVGDKVRVIECRPLSKMKRWRLVEVIERAKKLENAEEAGQ